MRFALRHFWVIATATAALPICAHAAVRSHWKFDETSGLVAADSGGTVVNNATWADPESTNLNWGAGQIGGAAILTGETGAANFFDVGSIEADGVTQLSYSMWLKPNLVQTGSGGDFINKGVFTSGSVEVLRTAGPTANQFWGTTWEATTSDPNTAHYRFRMDSTGTSRSSDVYDGTETEPEWVHLVFTWDGTAGDPNAAGDEEIKIYVNGALDASGTRNAAQIIDDGNWQIGKDRTFSGRTYGGLIDDLVVWDEVLTEAEIMMIYDGGLNGIDAPTALLGDAVLGDVNGDGLVNSADFEFIRQNFWQPFEDRTDGDLVDNDFIDLADYAQWKQATKDPDPASAATTGVPEPATLWMVALSAAGLLFFRQN